MNDPIVPPKHCLLADDQTVSGNRLFAESSVVIQKWKGGDKKVIVALMPLFLLCWISIACLGGAGIFS